MKKIILLIAVTIIFYSCQKDNPVGPDVYNNNNTYVTNESIVTPTPAPRYKKMTIYHTNGDIMSHYLYEYLSNKMVVRCYRKGIRFTGGYEQIFEDKKIIRQNTFGSNYEIKHYVTYEY